MVRWHSPKSRAIEENRFMIRFCVVALYFTALTLFGVVARLPLGGAAATIISFMAMAFAGIACLRRLLPALDSSICVIIFGSILGLAGGRICLVLTGLCFGPSSFAAALALGLLLCAALLSFWPRPPALPRWNGEDWHELLWILGLNSAILLAMTLPYWGAGHLTSKGYAFVPHFDEDYLNHISVTAELAHSLPPQNPYFAGQTLHYYWFYHLWPAAVVNLSGATARDALVLTLPWAVLLFVGALTCLVRLFMPRSSPRHLAVGLGFLSPSFIGLVYLASIHT